MKAGDKVMYTRDVMDLKGKLAYIIAINGNILLVEFEPSDAYHGLDRSSMRGYLERRSNEELKAFDSYVTKIKGNFCQMEVKDVQIVETSESLPARNETYLFPDIKDLK